MSVVVREDILKGLKGGDKECKTENKLCDFLRGCRAVSEAPPQGWKRIKFGFETKRRSTHYFYWHQAQNVNLVGEPGLDGLLMQPDPDPALGQTCNIPSI